MLAIASLLLLSHPALDLVHDITISHKQRCAPVVGFRRKTGSMRALSSTRVHRKQYVRL
jgi:hypothetical protein